MKTIQLKLKTLLVLQLMGIVLLSGIPSFAQSLEGKWNIAKMNTRHSKMIQFTKDSLIFYEFDKRRSATAFQVEENRLVVDGGSIPIGGEFHFVNTNRLRLKPDRAKNSIDFARLKPTKTTLTKPEIEQLKYKVTYQNHPLTINFDGVEDNAGQIIRLEKIDSTYFLSFYRNDKRMGAMPIEKVSAEEIKIYGFPKEPFAVSGERVVSDGNSGRNKKVSSTKPVLNTAQGILGTWFYDHIQGRPPLSACTKKTFFRFTEGSVLQTKPYAENRSNGNCVAGSGIKGTYKIIGDNQIEVNQNGTTGIWKIQSLTKTKLVVERDGGVLTLTKK